MQRNPLGVDGRGAGASFFEWAAAGRDAQTGMSSQHSKRPDCQPVLGSCVYICCGVGACICIVLMLLSLLLLLMMIGAWGWGCIIMFTLTCCGATGCGAHCCGCGAYCCSTYGCAMGTGAGTEKGTCT